MSGLQLSRRYDQVVVPLLDDIPHSAGLLGDGSEVLGFDDEVSTDHDFGPRVQVFVATQDDADRVHAALERLPQRFEGFPVAYRDADRFHGVEHHQVEVTMPSRPLPASARLP